MKDFLDTENGESAVIPSPPVCIVLLTYMRTNMAVRTIQGILDNLDYPNRVWYIADDGSPSDHINALLNVLESNGEQLIGMHNSAFAQRPYCGTAWNYALEKAHQVSDFVLWLEDDWVLSQKMDLRPYVRVLLEREDVGIVSFRGLSLGLRTEIMGHRGIHYLKILREGAESSMAYSGNPLLRHRRYLFYNVFTTQNSPGDVEIMCDNMYRFYTDGPDIWRPAGLNPWGIFSHIGNERTW